MSFKLFLFNRKANPTIKVLVKIHFRNETYLDQVVNALNGVLLHIGVGAAQQSDEGL